MNYEVRNIKDKVKNKKHTVSVPGSKSITARALLIATLANGVSTLNGVQFSDDCTTFLNAIKSLGIGVEVNGTTVKIDGCGGNIPNKKCEVYVGSAGTAARFITAFLALSDGEYTVTSSEQMKARPQAPLISSLRSLGAEFEFLENENCFPFVIKGARSSATEVVVDITKSSQYLSALLISAVVVGKPFKIKTIGSHGMDYVRMTIDMMWSFGVTVEENDGEYTVFGSYSSKTYDIEPDVSAACYFYAMNRLLGTEIKVKGVMPHTMQGDVAFIKLIKDFNGGTVDMSAFSDQALTLSAVAPFLDRPTTICGVTHIRGQECNRINAILTNLSAMGVKVEEREDGVTVYPSKVHSARINTFGDHRVAMSFALCGLVAEGIVIDNAEVCSKTFKEYFSVLDGLINDIIN